MKISFADLIDDSLDDINCRLREFGLSPLKSGFSVKPEGTVSCFYEEELGFSLVDFTRLPTGTFKYIDAYIAGEWYLQNKRRQKRMVVPSSGNTARAVCFWALRSGVEVEAVVTGDSWYKMEPELKLANTHFTRFSGGLDNARKYAGEIARENGYFYFAPNELKIAAYGVISRIIERYEQKSGIKVCLYSQAVSGGVGPASVLLKSSGLGLLLIQPDDLSPIVDAIEHKSPKIVDGGDRASNGLIEPTLGTRRSSTYEKYLFPVGSQRLFGARVSQAEINNTWPRIRGILLKDGIMGDEIDKNFELEKSGVIAIAGTLKRGGQKDGIICAITGRGGKSFARPLEPDKVVVM